MQQRRLQRIKQAVANRQLDLTVILENVFDPHNIGAVLRTCDAIGLREIYVLYSDPDIRKEAVALGKRTSAGARKWVDVHLHNDPERCLQEVRKKYKRILCTHMDSDSVSVYETDFTQPTALLFGNEHDGVSPYALKHSDGNIIIPQSGMVQSLNISVACAITLFEVHRQRLEAGRYDVPESGWKADRRALFQEYLRRHEERHTPHKALAKD
ncbi:MAG: RNA methyltransferase [Phaeodactylibacter sp.]|nr:RNA methyltransferase [Phaeodactylibacter sp.]